MKPLDKLNWFEHWWHTRWNVVTAEALLDYMYRVMKKDGPLTCDGIRFYFVEYEWEYTPDHDDPPKKYTTRRLFIEATDGKDVAIPIWNARNGYQVPHWRQWYRRIGEALYTARIKIRAWEVFDDEKVTRDALNAIEVYRAEMSKR